MIYGVSINGIDTLEAWGLMLLADVTVEAPALKEYTADIPGGDGSLDYSAYTGYPHYKDRKLSFTLFSGVEDKALQNIRTALMLAWHGQQVELVLPDDVAHCYRGVLQVGESSGYNSGCIPITMRAEPLRYALQDTMVIHEGNGSRQLENHGMPVTPEITTTAETKISWREGEHTIVLSEGAGQYVSALVLPRNGTLTLEIETEGSVTFVWREGVL